MWSETRIKTENKLFEVTFHIISPETSHGYFIFKLMFQFLAATKITETFQSFSNEAVQAENMMMEMFTINNKQLN